MKNVPAAARPLEGRLIVSCQAAEGEPFRDPESMAQFARAAVEGGAAGIRANGTEDIRTIRRAVAVPILGIQKAIHADGRILITPSLESAREVVAAGADMVALDCTARGQRSGALERLRGIRENLRVPVLADIATLEEAQAAAAAGADFVLSTMRGYTADTEHIRSFDAGFLAALVRAVDVPVIAEGRIETPDQAYEALAAGAFAVVVGTAITRPRDITRRFASALERRARRDYCAGIDLGATNTKFGVVSPDGEVLCPSFVPTPAGGGRQALLDHLKDVARRSLEAARTAGVAPAALGIATAGWVDPRTGHVVYATENLPGWTGTRIADELHAEVGLPVAVENDANALAVAEKHFGLAKELTDFVCITLGTGVGGGCYIGGRLNRGAHFFANGLGHINIEPDGRPCTCGQRGCLEAYANAAALVRYGDGKFASSEEVIAAANAGVPAALGALRMYAHYLARGCASMVHLLDPQMLILSGGIAQNNPALLANLEDELRGCVTVWSERGLRLGASPLAYYGGVCGAAAVAREKLQA